MAIGKDFKTRWIHRLALAAGIAVATPGHAEKDCSKRLRYIENFSRSLTASEAKLSAHFKEKTTLHLAFTDGTIDAFPNAVAVTLIKESGEQRPLRASAFQFRNADNAVGYLLSIDSELQRLGLSTVVQAFILLHNTHIERIEDSLLQDNASGFASSLVGHKSIADFSYRPNENDRDALVARAQDPHERATLRADILRAYREFTAAGVVNERFGFHDVRRIRVRAYEDDITANYSAHFGEANDDATEIIFEVYSWKKELELNLAENRSAETLDQGDR